MFAAIFGGNTAEARTAYEFNGAYRGRNPELAARNASLGRTAMGNARFDAEHLHNFPHFFGVWEVALENQRRRPSERDGDKDTVLWQIWPNDLSPDEKVIRRLPAITYGSVPTGFIQRIPKDGRPPVLIEGKIYEAGGPASNANGGFVWFTVKSGKVVKVDAPGGY